jgi:hypothetical protein
LGSRWPNVLCALAVPCSGAPLRGAARLGSHTCDSGTGGSMPRPSLLCCCCGPGMVVPSYLRQDVCTHMPAVVEQLVCIATTHIGPTCKRLLTAMRRLCLGSPGALARGHRGHCGCELLVYTMRTAGANDNNPTSLLKRGGAAPGIRVCSASMRLYLGTAG